MKFRKIINNDGTFRLERISIQQKPVKTLTDDERKQLKVNTQIKKFWSRVTKKGEDECWEYNDPSRMYFSIYFNHRFTSSQQISYEITNGNRLLHTKHIRMKCANRSCVNPKHMEIIENEPINMFWSNVDVKGEDECWEYKHERIRVNGSKQLPNRISYILTNGQIPEGKQVGRICRNIKCVNPKHLKLIDTTRELFPERYNSHQERKNPWHKVDYEIAQEMRFRFDELQERECLLPNQAFKKLASEYKTTPRIVSHIIKNETWKSDIWGEYYKKKYNYDTKSPMYDPDNIGKKIRDEYNELIKEGMLPSQAIRKLNAKYKPIKGSGYIRMIVNNSIYKEGV